MVLQLLSALPKCDESRGLKPLNTHVKEVIWKRERVFFSPFIFHPQEVASRDEIQWILQCRNLIAAEWIFV